jgi:hypothetical protein
VKTEFCREKSSLHHAPKDFAAANSILGNELRWSLAQLPKRKTQKSSSAATFCAGGYSMGAQNSIRARMQ